MYAIIRRTADEYQVIGKLASEAEARAEILQLCEEAEKQSREAARVLLDALFVATLH